VIWTVLPHVLHKELNGLVVKRSMIAHNLVDLAPTFGPSVLEIEFDVLECLGDLSWKILRNDECVGIPSSYSDFSIDTSEISSTKLKQTLTSSLYNVSHSYRLAAIELLFRHFSKTFVAAELEVRHDVRQTD